MKNTLKGLSNTKVVFQLPHNATTVCQPLDQGLINAWKAHYKSKWVGFLSAEYDRNKDPLKTISTLQTIRWGMEGSLGARRFGPRIQKGLNWSKSRY